MKHTTLLSFSLGGALLLSGMTPMPVEADQAADIAELKQMLLDQSAEISDLKQEVSDLKQNPVAPAQPVNVKELEQQVADLAENQSTHEDSYEDKVDIHVSLSQGYLLSDNNNWVADTEDGTFSYNEFAFNAGYQVSDKLRAGLQIMSRDFGPLMNNRVYLDWAIADYAWQDALGLRFGRLKTAYGLHNESRDIDGARISILLPQSVYPERVRDLVNGLDGVGLYGTLDMGMAGVLSYQAAAGKRDFDQEGGTARYLESSPYIAKGSISSMYSRYISHIQLDYATPLEGLRLMASYLEGEAVFDVTTAEYGPIPGGMSARVEISDYSEWTFSLEYTWDNLIVAGEYREISNFEQNFIVGGNSVPQDSQQEKGWYVSASYRFVDWFAAEISYSEFHNDADDMDGDFFVANGQDDFLTWQKDIAVTGRFDINDNWIIKAGVNFSDGLAGGFFADYPTAGEADQHWMLYQLKTTVSF